MDARELLAAGPEGYTAARDAEAKRRRAEGDRAGATVVKALGRPSLALWAVLAAADDEALARRAVEATDALAGAQRDAAGAGGPGSVATATAARRAAVDAVRDAAVQRLADVTDARRAAGQRDEIRLLVDRVSRHAELLGAWLDGTLRDVPDDTGFEAFADLAEIIPLHGDRPRRTVPPGRVSSSDAPVDRRAAEERERRARERARRDADAVVAAAERELAAAERELRDAEAAVREAQQQHDEAATRAEAARAARAALDD